MILFDERGNRAQKLTVGWQGDEFVALPGHFEERKGYSEERPMQSVWGFIPERTWRPTYYAHKMAKGYRVFGLDAGACEYVEVRTISALWRSDEGKRLPTVAAVEMWVRMVGVRT